MIDRLTCSLVAQERAVTAVPGTRMHALCGSASFLGFHWCNFGVAAAYVERLADHGLTIAARADDAGVEAIELAAHPFFMATLFQPQIGSVDGRPLHPVLEAFVAAVRALAGGAASAATRPEAIKARLYAAWLAFHPVLEDDFPPNLRDSWRQIDFDLTRREPNENRGDSTPPSRQRD